MVTKLSAVLACVALLATVALVTAGAAGAAKSAYPANVEKAFMKSCVKAATKGGLSRKKGRTYCRSALTCIEGKMTLKKFEHADADAKPIRSCEKQALKKIS